MFTGVIMLAVLLGVAVGVTLDVWRHPPERRSDGLPAADRLRSRTRLVRAGAAVLALAASQILVWLGVLGRGLMLAPAAFAVVLVLAIGIGEQLVLRRADDEAIALVEVRSVRDYRPRTLTTVVIGMSVVLLALLIATTVTASADDLGRPGRWVSWTCGPSASGAAGPYPGSFYSIPAISALALVWAAWAAATWSIASRRRTGVSEAYRRVDDELRARSASVVTAAALTGVSAMTLGTAAVTAAVLLNAARPVATCPAPSSFAAGGWIAAAIALAAAVCFGWGVTRMLVPRTAQAAAVASQPREASLP